MKDRETPKTRAAAGRGKWITFALLAALAAFIYAGIIMVKVMEHGF
jgi:hypothetical protein